MDSGLCNRRRSILVRHSAAGRGGSTPNPASQSRCSAPISIRGRSTSRTRRPLSAVHRGRRRRGAAASLLRARRRLLSGADRRCAILVLFAVHDLLKDPPFSHVDLISCRNVLIYLDRELAGAGVQHVSTTPSIPGGYPLPRRPPRRLTTRRACSGCIDRTARIYQSTAARRQAPAAAAPARCRCAARAARPARPRPESDRRAGRSRYPSRRASSRWRRRSILVDESHRVVHLSENAGRFVMPSGGPLSGDAVDLVRPELRFELRSALYRAFEQTWPTLSVSDLSCAFNGARHRVHLLVKPRAGEGADRACSAL